jgi:LPXTG-motif cell wall-anchored protein
MRSTFVSSVAAVAVFALTAFAATPAIAVSRTVGQIDQDFGDAYLRGIDFNEINLGGNEAEWTASVAAGSTIYVAGLESDNVESVIVSKYVSGVRDTSFGTSGVARFSLDNTLGEFDRVNDIEVADNGDLVIFGSLSDFNNYELTQEAGYALRITNTGSSTLGVDWGNDAGEAVEGSSNLALAAFYPAFGRSLNMTSIESSIEDAVSYMAEGVERWVVTGDSYIDDSGTEEGWVLALDHTGAIDTFSGGSGTGYQYFDSDFNTDESGTNCYNYSWTRAIAYDSVTGRVFVLGDCDGPDTLFAYDANNLSPDESFSISYGEPGVVEIGTYSTLIDDVWEMTMRDGELILAGDGYDAMEDVYVPAIMVVPARGANPYGDEGEPAVIEVIAAEIANFGSSWDLSYVEADSAGNIYIGGTADDDLFSARFLANNTYDTAYSAGGVGYGMQVTGSCGYESGYTAAFDGSNLMQFGTAHIPPANGGESLWTDWSTVTAKVFAANGTQTAALVAAPVWIDEELDLYESGVAYSDGISASGTGVTYYLDDSLPNGLSLNPATGAITGTPDDEGSYEFEVCAGNSSGYAWGFFTINSPAPIDPVIDGADELPAMVQGTAMTHTIDVEASPVAACEVSDGQLPPGLTLDEITCTISGTPLIVGDYWFEITAENENNSDYQVYEGTITGTNTLDIGLELDASIGEQVGGAPVDFIGWGLQGGSDWYGELRSDPVTIAEDTANEFGWFTYRESLPDDIEPGEHTITVYGTSPDGDEVSAVIYITVRADGTLGYLSDVMSESASLASTGADSGSLTALAAIGALALLAGAVFARRRNATV